MLICPALQNQYQDTVKDHHMVQARMAAILAWLAPRSAAVRSLRLRASDSSSGRKDLVSPVSWAQFVPLLNNITNEHDRQLVARKMQPLLMAAWAEPEYPHVQHDYTRYTEKFRIHCTFLASLRCNLVP